MKAARFAGLLLLALVATSCATDKTFEHWSSRRIDRPYTLPDRLDAWSLGARTDIASPFRLKNGSYDIFGWSQSLTDDWELEWSPLPVSVAHALSSGRIVSGASAGLIPVWNHSGWGLEPFLQYDMRWKWQDNSVVGLSVLAASHIDIPHPAVSVAGGVEGRWEIQWGDSLNTRLSAGIVRATGRPVDSVGLGGQALGTAGTFNAFVGADVSYNVGRNWDWRLEADRFLYGGLPVAVQIELINYW